MYVCSNPFASSEQKASVRTGMLTRSIRAPVRYTAS